MPALNLTAMRIAINGNRHQEGHFEEIDRLISYLVKRGDDVVLSEPFYNYRPPTWGTDSPSDLTAALSAASPAPTWPSASAVTELS